MTRVHLCIRKNDRKYFALIPIEKTLINRSILNDIDVLREMLNVIEVYMTLKYIHLLLPYIDEGKKLFERIKNKGLDTVPEMNNLFQELSYLADNWDVEPDNLILRPKFNHEHLLFAPYNSPRRINSPWQKDEL